MVSLDRDGEFSLADEVHEGLLLVDLVLLCLILVFRQLPVKFRLVFLLEIDDVGTGENAFKFHNEQRDTFISLFLFLQSNLLNSKVSREALSF